MFSSVWSFFQSIFIYLKHSKCHSWPRAEMNSSSSMTFRQPAQMFSDDEGRLSSGSITLVVYVTSARSAFSTSQKMSSEFDNT